MAELTPNAANYRPLDSTEARHITLKADVALTAGMAVYMKPNGRLGPARGNAIGTAKPVGIVTRSCVAGDAVEAQLFGRAVGWDGLEAIPAGTTVFVSSTTAGSLTTTAPSGTGAVVAPLGTVYRDTRIGGQDRAYVYLDVSPSFNPTALA